MREGAGVTKSEQVLGETSGPAENPPTSDFSGFSMKLHMIPVSIGLSDFTYQRSSSDPSSSSAKKRFFHFIFVKFSSPGMEQ